MITFPEFYRKYMVRKLSNIYTPKPIIDTTILFPKNSTIYHYSLNLTDDMITKSGLLYTSKNLLVKTIDKYTGDTLGAFRLLPAEFKPYVQSLVKHEPKINFIKNNTAVMTSTTIVVKNFLGLYKFYKYPSNPLLEYWRTHNIIVTIISEINKELERDLFIPVYVDTTLHYTRFLDLMGRKVTSGVIKYLPSNDLFFMFELWKMFFKDHREDSLLSKIKPEKLKKVNFIFNVGNRCIIINLGVLLSISNTMEEITLESGLKIIADIFQEELTLEDLTMESAIDKNIDFKVDLWYDEETDTLKPITEEMTTETAILQKLNKVPEKVLGKLIYIMCNKLKTSSLEITLNMDTTLSEKSEIFKVLTKKEPEVIEAKPTTVEVANKNATTTEESKTKIVEPTKVVEPAKNTTAPAMKTKPIVIDTPIVAPVEEPKDLKTDKTTDEALDKILDMFGSDIVDIDNPDEEDLVSDLEADFASNDIEEDLVNSSDINNTVSNSRASIEEDIFKEPELGSKLVSKINDLSEAKVISKSRAEKLISAMEENRNRAITVNGEKVKIGDIIKEDLDYETKEEDINIKGNIIVKDKEMLKNTSIANTKHYLNKAHEKLLIKTLMFIENGNFVVSNLEVEETKTILGGTANYKIELMGVDGSRNTLQVVLPTVDKETATYTLSKNNYIMRRQRNDLPIRKISHNEVSLNSDYGKLFITRGVNKTNDKGYWIKSQLLKLYNNDVISNYVTNKDPFEIEDVELPSDYTTLAKFIKFFNFKDMSFNFYYPTRNRGISPELLEKLEQDGVVIGTKNGNPMIMRDDNIIYEYVNKKFMEIGRLYELLEIEEDNAPYEMVTIKIFNTSVPLIFILGYYYGLEKVLKYYDIEYYYDNTKVRVDTSNYIVIKLAEDRLVIKRGVIADMLFSGFQLLKESTRLLRRFETRSDFDIVFNLMNYSLLVRNEVTNLDDYFISPVTYDLLKKLKLPLTFRGLLFKSIDMLADDHFKNPKNISDTVFKGYDRFSGMLYKELTISLREQKNKSEFSKASINLNPYGVIKKLNEDSTTLLVNDTNPISNLKQYEDVTYLGSGGRSKESLSRKTRGYDVNDIGILSEANKDSGDVGITSYLTASPGIINSLGMLQTVDVDDNTSWAQLFSTAALLAPFSNNDDTKRLMFSGIQAEHVVPVIGMDVPYVRGEYDTMIANRIAGKYAIISKGNGMVTYVDSKKVVVKYDDEDKEVTYKLITWYSKTESNSCYKHTMVPNFRTGDKIGKDDVLGYISSFFIPDPYDKRRVVYLQHKIARVAFMEDLTTYEDSTALSEEFATKMHIENIKVNNLIVDAEDNLVYSVKIGSTVKVEESLVTTSNQHIDLSNLTEEEIELMNENNNTTLKSKYNGVVDNFEIYYNCELEEISPSLRELVNNSDKRLKEKTGFTGKVNSSYSINGNPLEKGSLEIKVFVSIIDDMGIADKAIYGNQLKCTVGDIFKSIKTYDDGRPVDATFSTTSFKARITPSFTKIGLLSTGARKIEENAVEMYFG